MKRSVELRRRPAEVAGRERRGDLRAKDGKSLRVEHGRVDAAGVGCRGLRECRRGERDEPHDHRQKN